MGGEERNNGGRKKKGKKRMENVIKEEKGKEKWREKDGTK